MSAPSPPSRPISHVGVVGAGQMGSGIAHVCALAGLSVVMTDSRAEALDKALAGIAKNMARQESKGTIEPGAKEAALPRITAAPSLSAFADCDIVIEAAVEKEEVKRTIFRDLQPHLRPDAILASNTSSISITRLGAATDRPGRFIGMHFFNPVPMMKLVEIIRGIATEDATFEAVRGLAERLGKTTATAEDYPGFVVNRVLVPMINEACFALMEGVGDVRSIDAGMRAGANHPMGPLELADLIGLDTCLSVIQVMHAGLGDGKYRPCPLLVKYVDAGWLGRKSGRGFYDYSGPEPVPSR